LNFLHMAFSERPIICRCHLNVQWPVNSPVTSLHFFLSHCTPRRFIHRSFNEELQLPHTWCGVPLHQPHHPPWAYRHKLRLKLVVWDWEVFEILSNQAIHILITLNSTVTGDPEEHNFSS
jgi:hypothetical protein